MKIATLATADHHLDFLQRFEEGLRLHSFTVDRRFNHLREMMTCHDHFDVIVTWGLRNTMKARNKCDNVVILERAYFEDRMIWTSVGLNDLNGRADFGNQDSPADRWEKHFDDGRMKDWSSGDHVLLTTQVKKDWSLLHVDVDYGKIVAEIRQHTDLPIYVKHHPVAKVAWETLPGVHELDVQMPIVEAVEKARVVVTINSNSGVDAILAGTPVVNLDQGSMVWDIAERKFDKLEQPPLPDRMQWAYNTSYCQWLPDEISRGETWAHIGNRLRELQEQSKRR